VLRVLGQQALQGLEGISEALAIQYLPTLLNLLFSVMCNHTVAPGFYAFKALIKIANKHVLVSVVSAL
jgi:hypothetical protein